MDSFKTVLVMADTLDISSDISFGVFRGAETVTTQRYRSQGATAQLITFNCPIPSQTTIVDRRAMLKTRVTFKVKGTATPTVNSGNVRWLNYGYSDGFPAYPLNQLIQTASATINNSTVSVNQMDVLASTLRCVDKESLHKYNSTTPTVVDQYQKYSDALNTANNNLSAYENGEFSGCIQPNGAFRLISSSSSFNFTANSTDPTNVESTVVVELCEPLLNLSPFLWSIDNQSQNAQGFYGINQITLNLNLGQANRFFRLCDSVTQGYQNLTSRNLTVEIDSFSDTELIFQMLTPPATLMLPSMNTVPYLQIDRYPSPYNATINSNSTATIVSNSFQLSTIPDRLIIFANSKQVQNKSNSDTDSWLPIKSVQLQFNNKAGLLSTMTQQDLYYMSVSNGYSGSWNDWSGKSLKGSKDDNFTPISTSGSILIVEMGKDVGLEPYLAPSSLGQFNLNVQVEVENNFGVNLSTVELQVLAVSSGVWVTERGSSSSYVGLLSKSQVLEAQNQEPIFRSHITRMLGGGFWDFLKSGLKKIASFALPKLKEVLKEKGGDLGLIASQGLEKLGYGKGKKMDQRLM